MLPNMSTFADGATPAQRLAGRKPQQPFRTFFAASTDENGVVRARVASLDEANSHGHIFRASVWETPQPVVISDWGHSSAIDPWWVPRMPVGDGMIALEEDDSGLLVPMLTGQFDLEEPYPVGAPAYRLARRRGKTQKWSIAYYWDWRMELEEDGLNLIITEAVTDEASMVLRAADVNTYTDEVSAQRRAAARQGASPASMLTPEQREAFRLGQEWFTQQHLRGER